MGFFDDFENEYGPDSENENEINYNIRRDIEEGCSRREIMRRYGVSSDYVDAMDLRGLLNDEEEDRYY